MGNWHCIPSSCAEVVYQKYEPSKIRWRYGSEAWQEITGANDYTIQANETKNISWIINNNNCDTVSNNYQVIGCVIGGTHLNGFGNYIYAEQNRFFENNIICLSTSYYGSHKNQEYYYAIVNGVTDYVGWLLDVQVKAIIVKSCKFKVTKNGTIVHQETRAVCPEVEKIPCKLSDVKHSIEIKKLPFLEKIEVVPYQYSAYRAPGVPAPIVQADQIPTECLNIYNNAIYVIPPFGQAIYPNATPFDSFITQICSYPGCPPPEYQVICDCSLNSCQSCPEGTCPIECDDHICCYNDYGVSIQSIPQADYCGGNS